MTQIMFVQTKNVMEKALWERHFCFMENNEFCVLEI